MKFLLSALLMAATPAFAAPAVVGQAAPNFSVTDTGGKAVSLADFKGKTVVLEWVNPGCPYVRKHYDSANMQATQKGATAGGVVRALRASAADWSVENRAVKAAMPVPRVSIRLW